MAKLHVRATRMGFVQGEGRKRKGQKFHVDESQLSAKWMERVDGEPIPVRPAKGKQLSDKVAEAKEKLDEVNESIPFVDGSKHSTGPGREPEELVHPDGKEETDEDEDFVDE